MSILVKTVQLAMPTVQNIVEITNIIVLVARIGTNVHVKVYAKISRQVKMEMNVYVFVQYIADLMRYSALVLLTIMVVALKINAYQKRANTLELMAICVIQNVRQNA
jgi:hypothetical protein